MVAMGGATVMTRHRSGFAKGVSEEFELLGRRKQYENLAALKLENEKHFLHVLSTCYRLFDIASPSHFSLLEEAALRLHVQLNFIVVNVKTSG
jgi:hypothetical protein